MQQHNDFCSNKSEGETQARKKYEIIFQTVIMTLFLGASLALGSALELLFANTELVVAGCCIKFTFHCTSQSNRELVFCVE